jgi:hypothetical protein
MDMVGSPQALARRQGTGLAAAGGIPAEAASTSGGVA